MAESGVETFEPGMPHLPDPTSLRLFVAVCETRSIAAAAARESLVASAVSKRIAAVERDLGVMLLVRGRRGVVPTDAGEVLLRQAREVIGALERLRSELGEFGTGVQGSVRVIASLSALAEALPDDIADFLARHAAVRVSVDESVSSRILRALRDGSADIGVLWDAADFTGLRAIPYRRDRLCAIVRPDHPLAAHRRVRYALTLEHPAIGVAPGGMMEALLRREAARQGRAVGHRIQVASIDAALRIVAAGLGLAILPREATALYADAAGLVSVPLAEPWAERQLVLCTRAGPSPPTAVRLLVEHLSLRAASSGCRDAATTQSAIAPTGGSHP